MDKPSDIDPLAGALAAELHRRGHPAERELLKNLRRRIEVAEATLDKEIDNAKS